MEFTNISFNFYEKYDIFSRPRDEILKSQKIQLRINYGDAHYMNVLCDVASFNETNQW